MSRLLTWSWICAIRVRSLIWQQLIHVIWFSSFQRDAFKLSKLGSTLSVIVLISNGHFLEQVRQEFDGCPRQYVDWQRTSASHQVMTSYPLVCYLFICLFHAFMSVCLRSPRLGLPQARFDSDCLCSFSKYWSFSHSTCISRAFLSWHKIVLATRRFLLRYRLEILSAASCPPYFRLEIFSATRNREILSASRKHSYVV